LKAKKKKTGKEGKTGEERKTGKKWENKNGAISIFR
jgi:hypothetical protein